MSGAQNNGGAPEPGGPQNAGGARGLARALRVKRPRFSLMWLIPIVAALISIYLAVAFLANRGPLITISFNTANGITAQQTTVQHKAVALGTVEDVHLSQDLAHVIIHVRMKRQGEHVLTDHARFWVVRPRLSPGNISGLETLVSGAYIEVDPGAPGGAPRYEFKGLEEPPGVRSDEPGSTYRLRAAKLGSLGPGSPVYYRDVTVGEVLSYDLGDGLGPVTINVFVKSPYDHFVHDNTHFYNISGLSVEAGAQGLHIELQSFQALLSGGLAFETPRFGLAEKPSEAGHTFRLYDDKDDADSAGFAENIPYVAYFTSSVSGLSRGSTVQVFGLQVGTVTDVRLLVDPATHHARARVAFNLQPERLTMEHPAGPGVARQVIAGMVQDGMRVVLESSSFITGTKDLSLEWVPNAPQAATTQEGDATVLPSQGGGLDGITSNLAAITDKIKAIPFDQIGDNLNRTLKSVSDTVSGPDMRTAIHRLSETLADVQNLVKHTDAGLQPALKRLPEISDELQHAIQHADALLGDSGYGSNSDFQRNVQHLLDQVGNAARSIRLLADYLDRHPEALIRGRTGRASEK